MQVAFDDWPGRTVLDSAGRMLGEVTKLVVDSDSWAVSVLRIKLRRSVAEQMGVTWSPFRITSLEIPTGLVFAAGDAIILRVPIEELQNITVTPQPEFQLSAH